MSDFIDLQNRNYQEMIYKENLVWLKKPFELFIHNQKFSDSKIQIIDMVREVEEKGNTNMIEIINHQITMLKQQMFNYEEE